MHMSVFVCVYERKEGCSEHVNEYQSLEGGLCLPCWLLVHGKGRVWLGKQPYLPPLRSFIQERWIWTNWFTHTRAISNCCGSGDWPAEFIVIISQTGLHLFAGFDFNFPFAGTKGQVTSGGLFQQSWKNLFKVMSIQLWLFQWRKTKKKSLQRCRAHLRQDIVEKGEGKKKWKSTLAKMKSIRKGI